MLKKLTHFLSKQENKNLSKQAFLGIIVYMFVR